MPKFLGPFSKGRYAVSGLFYANGLIVGAWVPMIPAFAAQLDITESEIGILILMFGIGSLIAMPVVGTMIAKIGTAKILYIAAPSCALSLLVLVFSPTYVVAMMIMLLFGASVGGMDVAMNANVIRVERLHSQFIMSSCHGFWSLGGLTGALLGGLSISTFGGQGHGAIWAIIALVIMIFSLFLIQGGDARNDQDNSKMVFPKKLAPYLLGVAAFFSVIAEGITFDWSALFLQKVHAFDQVFSGLGYAAMAGAMAIMRMFGDQIRMRFGSVLAVRVSVCFAIVGFGFVAFLDAKWLIILGFFIIGLGAANLFPIALSAAGNLPGIRDGLAVSTVAMMGYAGILIAPPLFGFVAEIWGLATIFMITPVLMGIIFLVMSPVRYADKPRH